MPEPRLYVFAGPNGSGKSTATNALYAAFKSLPALYINADEIAITRGMNIRDAAAEAARQRNEALSKHLSFVMETVMSTYDKVEFLREAKSAGYHVHLEYLTTQDPEINAARVSTRVEAGGHEVPTEKVLSRYARSMDLLREAIAAIDTARVYNNSFDRPVLIAEKTRDGRIVAYPQPPPSIWSEERILLLIG
jgi:predicted ABC-type ATPase